MKKIICTLLLTLLIISISAQNLIVNPGFENGLNNWPSFTNYPSNFTFIADNTVSLSGTSSGKIRISNATQPLTGIFTQYTQVAPGEHYLFECNIKTDSVNGVVQPYLIFIENDNRLYGNDGGYIDSTNNWKKFRVRFSPPLQCDTLQIVLILSGTKGSAWFDDISLTRITDTTKTNFSVNLSQTTGNTIRAYRGTNIGPVDPPLTANLSNRFAEVAMDMVRTHDYEGPCDISVIFPDTSKNPLDSTAYDFTMTDSVIKAIVLTGAQVFFRLGESASLDSSKFYPPADYDKWAQVCVQIIKHYNDGWNNGFNYNINYWEIYNEPDGPRMWKGTTTEYIKLYRIVSKKIKAYNPSLKVGGPAISNIYVSRDFLNEFLDSIKTYNYPFDFFSYHYYHTYNPVNFLFVDNHAKKILNNYGLNNIPRIVSEWGPGFSYENNNNTWRDDPYMAATLLSAFTYYQKTNVDQLLYYRTDENDLGLFDASGNYTYKGAAFRLFGTFIGANTELQTIGSDSLGKTIIAGKAVSGDIAIAIADNSSAANGYNLNFSNIGSDVFSYNLIRVDSNNFITVTSSGLLSASQTQINQNVKAPFCDLLILSKVTGIKSENTQKDVSVFPNPFNNSTGIYIHNPEINKIIIQNILGETTREFDVDNTGNTVIYWNGTDNNAQMLSQGVYLLHSISNKGKIGTLKIIITHK